MPQQPRETGPHQMAGTAPHIHPTVPPQKPAKDILRILWLTVLLFSVSGLSLLRAGNTNKLHHAILFSMETLEDATLTEGLAGSYFGKQGDYFILAGGSSFPAGKPWEGGKKHFSDQVFLFQQQPDGNLKVVYRGNNLPRPLAEGAYASLPQGLLCMGGLSGDTIVSDVYLLSYNGREVTVTTYPPLPVAVKHAAAAVIGSRVWLAGGEQSGGSTSSQLLMLDANNPGAGWQELSPLPQPVSGATLTAQQDGEEIALFLIGGRAKNHAGTTIFYSTVLHYRPSTGIWKQRDAIRAGDGSSLSLSMAVAAPVGASHILLYGGDSGNIFQQVEQAALSGQTGLRDSLQQHHGGFNRRILVYNTVTDAWFEESETAGSPVAVEVAEIKEGKTAGSSMTVADTWSEKEKSAGTPVAVAAAWSDGKNILIAGGEIRPGVRSPYITQLTYTTRPSFGWLNYVVLLLYFGGMLFLGFFFMQRNKDTDDFFKAGGRIPWWAAGISIFATTLSAITFLSIPAKTYATDWRMLLFNICIILIVPVVIRYFLPFFRRFSFDTAYQYLEHRFSRPVRWLASALFVIFMISRIAIVLFLPSLALHAVTGFNIYLSIIVMGIVTIIYSTSGGMEAVVWGDVIQGFILVIGAIAAFLFMIMGIEGGFGEFWSTSVDFHKFRTFDFRFDFTQPVFWVVLIGGVANALITYTSDQSVIQRYMSTKDEKATSRSIWLNGFLSVPVTLLFFLIGTGLFAYYKDHAAAMMVANPNIDSVFPQFIVTEMPAGFAGLLIAAIFAAAMSTLSSNINSSAAVITSDFYKTLSRRSTFTTQMQVARWSGIICGLLGLGMALILATWNIASLWDQFNTFLGLLTSGLGAIFILGIFFPRVGAGAALSGVVAGLVILVLVRNNTPLSFLLYGFIGMVTSIVIALVVCLFFLILPVYKDFLIIRYPLLLISIELARIALASLAVAAWLCLYGKKRDTLFALLLKIGFVASLALDILVIYSRAPEDLNGLFISLLLLLAGYLVPFMDRLFKSTVLIAYSVVLAATILFHKDTELIAKNNIIFAMIGIDAIGIRILLNPQKLPERKEGDISREAPASESFSAFVRSKVSGLPLSGREKEVVCHTLMGETRSEIADKMSLSNETIKKHSANIFTKLKVSSKSELFDAILGEMKDP